jgi:hypothetical protein
MYGAVVTAEGTIDIRGVSIVCEEQLALARIARSTSIHDLEIFAATLARYWSFI